MNTTNRMAVAIASAALIVSLAANVTLAVRQRENKVNIARTNSALCTFRSDLNERAVNTLRYLHQHQSPFILGIPRSTFLVSLHGQEQTLRSLRDLHC